MLLCDFGIRTQSRQSLVPSGNSALTILQIRQHYQNIASKTKSDKYKSTTGYMNHGFVVRGPWPVTETMGMKHSANHMGFSKVLSV